MIKNAFIILTGITLLCSGCGYEPAQAKSLTQSNAQNPQQVCEMPDGRILYCIEVVRPDGCYSHYVYYFSGNDTKTVSVNYSVPQGKTSRNEVIVLNGKEYNLVPKN